MPARTGVFIGPSGYYANDLASVHPQDNNITPGAAPAPVTAPPPVITPPTTTTPVVTSGTIPSGSYGTPPPSQTSGAYPGTSNIGGLLSGYKPPKTTTPSTYSVLPANFETELANALLGQSR